MVSKEEWVQEFEKQNGRKPTLDEFMTAKTEGFPNLEASLPSDSASFQEESSQQNIRLKSEKKKETPDISSLPNPFLKGRQNKDNVVFNIVLPIFVLVFGFLFTIMAWILPISVLFTLLVFISFGLAIVSMALSLKSSRKALSIIAVVLSGIFLVTSVGGTVYQVARWLVEHPAVFDTDELNKASEYIDSDYQFDWTEQQFKELKVNETSLEEVLATHGNATEAEWSDGDLILTYTDQEDNRERVVLTFVAAEGAKYLLKTADASFTTDQVKTSQDTVSSWSQSDFDDLKLGTTENLLKGTHLSEVLDKHPDATYAYSHLTWTRNGDLTQSLMISYYNFDKKEDQLTSVSLNFNYDTREDAYFLVNKY